MERSMKSVVRIGVLTSVVALSSVISGCASCSRNMKSISSDFSGGLERKVTLYSTTGEILGAWEGKLDLSESEDEIFFDLDGKRVIIHGGIVVVEEL